MHAWNWQTSMSSTLTERWMMDSSSYSSSSPILCLAVLASLDDSALLKGRAWSAEIPAYVERKRNRQGWQPTTAPAAASGRKGSIHAILWFGWFRSVAPLVCYGLY